MNNTELKNEDIPQKEMKSGSNPLILVGILIFLIIVSRFLARLSL